uniref:Uncharacterized protein n=1 Tax=Tanacetum cinerariifolium TaxID=118510 RepID=A0A699IDP0_TANCI|nr:hypothetical protein [Tanacetum cinerariifolium]
MDAVGNVYSDGEDLLRSGVTCDGCSKLINDIKAGKHDELLSEMTNDDRIEIMDALGTICKSIHADNNNADVIPYKVTNIIKRTKSKQNWTKPSTKWKA